MPAVGDYGRRGLRPPPRSTGGVRLSIGAACIGPVSRATQPAS